MESTNESPQIPTSLFNIDKDEVASHTTSSMTIADSASFIHHNGRHGPHNSQAIKRQAMLACGNEGSSEQSTLRQPDHSTISDIKCTPQKLWVRRPGGSATMVVVDSNDIVDDVRSCILHKYANSLGRYFDAPDICLRIHTRNPKAQRESRGRGHKLIERDLGPEERIGDVLESYFPGGQLVDDAIIIEISTTRTPIASDSPPAMVSVSHPSAIYTSSADNQPLETGETYFPNSSYDAYQNHPQHPYPYPQHQPPHLQHAYSTRQHSHPYAHAHHHAPTHYARGLAPTMATYTKTNVFGPSHHPLPSPGGGSGSMRLSRNYRERPERPHLGRTHTSSPGIMGLNPALGALSHHVGGFHNHTPIIGARSQDFGVMTTNSNIGGLGSGNEQVIRGLGDGRASMIAGSPPPGSSPSMINARLVAKKNKKQLIIDDMGPPPPGGVSHGVPPINVLIVEDNPINLKLLEAFVKRLKVRWKTAMNGKEAVAKWREGGFHLVLMDIQLPVMNGLDATREIRRLERVNSIGIFTAPYATSMSVQTQQLLLLPGQVSEDDKPAEQDKLEEPDLFKSPVIIVALTASSLQSDRHEALAAGCNDFLTKPVNFDWLERKVTEWGCMQALIDFDGWRRWKEFPTVGRHDKFLGVTDNTKKDRMKKYLS